MVVAGVVNLAVAVMGAAEADVLLRIAMRLLRSANEMPNAPWKAVLYQQASVLLAAAGVSPLRLAENPRATACQIKRPAGDQARVLRYLAKVLDTKIRLLPDGSVWTPRLRCFQLTMKAAGSLAAAERTPQLERPPTPAENEVRLRAV